MPKKSIFSVRINSPFKSNPYHLVGKKVDISYDNNLYHILNSECTAKAIKYNKSEKGQILLDDTIEDCEIYRQFEWISEYELQIFVDAFQNEKENIVEIYGSLDENVDIEDEYSKIMLRFRNKEIYVNIKKNKNEKWSIKVDNKKTHREDYSYINHYSSNDEISRSFSENSDVLRVGFKDKPKTVYWIYMK